MATAHDPYAITPELVWFSGWHDWEHHLSVKERHQLASSRAACEPRDEVELPFDRGSTGLPAGEDPYAQAAERLKAELRLYSRR